MGWTGEILVGLAILVGLVGVVVPVLPGPLLVGAAVLVWSVVEATAGGWVVLSIVIALLTAGQVLKYALAGRHLVQAGVPRRSLVVGGLAGIVGFFVVPVVGLPLGFVAGTYLIERGRLGRHDPAWRSTWSAVKATGLAILIELAASCLAAGVWLTRVLVVG